ncbi:helix-turn-helix domain-containing protein [Bariatricus sp. HCP28S3_D3]|uniref:helix-turn-helix domain-containing protein n=1 Tax=Bariatricus sp. HCP28S3_D3 TaxID=3438901 RepID=UPI003F896445
MNINERVRYLRKEKLHMTQEAFGSPLGLTRANIANIEAGRISVTERVVLGLCDKYNVDENWLRNGIGDVFMELSREEYIAEFIGRVLKDKEDSFKKRYIEMLSKLDEDGWEALKKVAIAMGSIKKD